MATLPKTANVTPATTAPATASTPSSSAAPASAVSVLTAGDEIGGRARPIHVVMEESRQLTAGRVIRTLGVTALYAFCILTVLSLVLENSGLMKAGSQPMEFEPEDGKAVKFDDVKGVDEAKHELEEIVEFLRNPERFSTLGGRCPKGLLLTGPPGTGKTMLARAVAGEAGVVSPVRCFVHQSQLTIARQPFLFASGSAFDEVLVGVGSKRIRELFAAAQKKSPAIVFIDELDAIGSKRTARDQQYMKQTLNQLLVELDGFEQSEGVIIIAATNFPESLDKALTRPGRFDRHVVVGLPDMRGRVEILKHHMADVQYDVDVDASIIARGTPGMSGADLKNLVNEAAVKAARDGETKVKLGHFEWAKDRILMGAERKSHYVTPESKNMTAYHEAGHALTALRTPGALPLHKVTIMPRGQALGITFQLPEADKDSYSKKELKASIDVALGGRAAEELIFGLDDTTTGCSSDLQRATSVAGNMVRNYGFSDKVGLVAHSDDDMPYLSGAKKDEIESEVRRFVEEGWERTKNVLKTNMEDLHTLAKALVEYETLSLDEVRTVLRGEKLNRQSVAVGEKLREPKEKQVIGMNDIA